MSTLGKLFVVGTPIGNLADITYRAIDVLNNVEFIFAEDTRVSKKLLNLKNVFILLKSFFDLVTIPSKRKWTTIFFLII